MGQTTTGSVEIIWNHSYTNAQDLNSVLDALKKNIKVTLANGTGANKAQHVFTDKRSLLTTVSEEIDLKTLTNAFGTLAITKIKAILINPITATTGYRLLVGGAAANAFSACFADPSDKVRVDSGSPLLLSSFVDGWTVDATHKLLKIENPSGGTFEYEILIFAEGALA